MADRKLIQVPSTKVLSLNETGQCNIVRIKTSVLFLLGITLQRLPVDTMVCLLWAYKRHKADGKIFTSRFFLPYTLSPLL